MPSVRFASILDSKRGRIERHLPQCLRTPVFRFAEQLERDSVYPGEKVHLKVFQDLSPVELFVQRLAVNLFPRVFVGSIIRNSMSPALTISDRVVCLEKMYLGGVLDPDLPWTEDIVAFWSPRDLGASIKRIAGISGDKTEMGTIPRDHCFVVGDNRENSFDSRSWGFLALQNIFAVVLGKCPDDNSYGQVVPFNDPGQKIPIRNAIRFGHTLQ
ncbi:MAG: S26 family signal peptidase [Candidatus Margulisiibacteriota bacterium]